MIHKHTPHSDGLPESFLSPPVTCPIMTTTTDVMQRWLQPLAAALHPDVHTCWSEADVRLPWPPAPHMTWTAAFQERLQRHLSQLAPEHKEVRVTLEAEEGHVLVQVIHSLRHAS